MDVVDYTKNMWKEHVEFFMKNYPDMSYSEAKELFAYDHEHPRIITTKLGMISDEVIGQSNVILYESDNKIANLGYHVLYEYQRLGIATKLCEEAIKTAKEKGVEVLVVDSLAGNVPSINLAKKLGFIEADDDIKEKYRQEEGDKKYKVVFMKRVLQNTIDS